MRSSMSTNTATTLSEIYRPIQSQLQAAETLLVEELASRENFRHSLMAEMARHVSRMPGKRIRPALALLGAAMGATSKRHPKKAISLAAAVEMFHTATLLHDDVIDGASLRRGLTTSNAKEDISQTYQLGVNSFIQKPLRFEQMVEFFSVMSKYWFHFVELPSED